MDRPYTIAISGMMGSGKTTLAKRLSSTTGWKLVPESPKGVKYLEDLFQNPKRWAFETQLAFLCDKAIQISLALKDGRNVIVDRSLYEDIEIFANYFHECGYIDDRSFETYSFLAAFFLGELPPPDFCVFCYCSLSVIKDRLRERNRALDALYPPGHLEKIANLYNNWLAAYSSSSIGLINSMTTNFLNETVVDSVCEDIMHLAINQRPDKRRESNPASHQSKYLLTKTLTSIRFEHNE